MTSEFLWEKQRLGRAVHRRDCSASRHFLSSSLFFIEVSAYMPGHLRCHNDPFNCPWWHCCAMTDPQTVLEPRECSKGSEALVHKLIHKAQDGFMWMWNKREAEPSGFRKQVLVLTSSRCILLDNTGPKIFTTGFVELFFIGVTHKIHRLMKFKHELNDHLLRNRFLKREILPTYLLNYWKHCGLCQNQWEGT